MSNFYYLYKYGTTASGASAKSFATINSTGTGSLIDSNFVGAMLEYNRFNLGDLTYFVTNNKGVETDNNSFDDFYNSYKTIVGSDALSYLNKYTNTSSFALGNMLNTSDGPSSATFTNNLVTDKSSFYFHATQDGDLYRYTYNDNISFQGTADALVNLVNIGTETPGSLNFNDIEAGYDSYYNYKIAQIDGTALPALTTAVNLADASLKLDYATIFASTGSNVADTKAIYQNLIDQIVAETKAIKSGTMTPEDIATMEKDLDAKQRGLKALDDALYGYVQDATSVTTTITHHYHDYKVQYDFVANPPSGADVTDFNTVTITGATHTMVAADYNSLYTALGDLVSNIRLDDALGIGSSTGLTMSREAFRSSIQQGISTWLEANPAMGPKGPTGFKDELNLANPTDASVQANVIDILDNDETIQPVILTTFSGQLGNIIQSSSNLKTDIETFINTYFAAQDAATRARATEVIWEGVQKSKFINDLTTHILGRVTETESTTVPTPVVETISLAQADITQREADMNYSFGDAAIRIDDLGGYIQDIRSFSAHDVWFRKSTYATDHPGINVQNSLRSLGIEIKKQSDNSAVPPGVTGGVNQELLYSFIGNGSISLVNAGNGVYTFSYNSVNYYIDTNVNLRNLDLGNIAGSLGSNYLSTTTMYRREDHTTGEMYNHVKDSLGSHLKVKGLAASDSALKLRHLKITDTNKGKALSDVDPGDAYNPNTDTNSLVYKLADSLLANNDITFASGATGTTDLQKREFAVYLSEVTAGIMEKYWLENFNKTNAEPIDVYFAREFKSYMNPYADSTSTQSYGFITSTGAIQKFNLSFDEDPAATTIVDKLLEKQSWAEIYTKIEDRSRLEMALFEESAAMDTVVNINNKEYEYRMNMLAALENLAAAHPTLGLDFSAVNKGLVTEGPGKEKNPWWSDYFPWFKGFYGNLPDGATADQMFDQDGHLVMKYSAPGSPLIDPYLVKINGVDYVMGKDDNKDGEISNAQEILGITDTVETTFSSLIALDANKDGYVSQEELKSQNIIFKAMNESARMNGSAMNTDFIKGIDLSTLKEGDGTNNIYGLFNVQLTNGQKAAAVQTFESQNYFNNLFGKYADMSFLKGEASSTSSTKDETAKTTISQKAKADDAKTIENKAFVKGFNFFNYIKDETATTDTEEAKAEETKTEEIKEETPVVKSSVWNEEQEKTKTVVINSKEITIDALIDDICWKSNIYRLTTKQKYDIIDSIDTSTPAELIVKKIQDELEQIHTGFSA